MVQQATKERLLREVKRLVLAKSDMRQVSIAADYLNTYATKMNSHVVRVMWTGIVVTYARPFSKNKGVGAVEGRLIRLDDHMQRSLHGQLCELRNQLFAHTDETELRGIVDASELLDGAEGYVEEHESMNLGALRDIVELADELEKRFAARVREIEEQLGRRRT
jgi:hypothetical protein